MPEVGEKGQLKLMKSRVLLIARADSGARRRSTSRRRRRHDRLLRRRRGDRSNLQRQISTATRAIGTPKVDSAREALLRLNPSIAVKTFRERLTAANVEEIFRGFDVIVDGSDNFATRYLVNDACV